MRILARAARGICLGLLDALARPFALDGDGALLVMAPHSDDECLGCGGLIATARGQGTRVIVAVAADGSGCMAARTMPRAALIAAREAETRAACALLGVGDGEIYFLGIPDGAIESEGARVRSFLADIVATRGVTRIACTAEIDGHVDHRALGRHCRAFVREKGAGIRLYDYMVWPRPRALLRNLGKGAFRAGIRKIDTRPVAACKRKALDQYRTQLGGAIDAAMLRFAGRRNEIFVEIS